MWEWLRRKLSGNQVAWNREEWQKSLQQLWHGSVDVHFTYTDKRGERLRRDVTVEKVLQDKDGGTYLYGLCHLRNEYRHFSLPRITSKIKVPSEKRFYHQCELLDLLVEGKQPAEDPPDYTFEPWETDIAGFLQRLLQVDIPPNIAYSKLASYGVVHQPGTTRQWVMRIYSYISYEKPTFWMEPYGGKSLTFFANQILPEPVRISLIERLQKVAALPPRITRDKQKPGA